ncbi:MAG: TIGR02677 family protein [Actinomycetota bacterium]
MESREPRAGLPERLRIFAFAVEPKAPLYRAVMRVFAEAKARYELRLRPAEVAGSLPEAALYDLGDEPGPQLEAALDQLVAWGNLKRLQDTTRARNLAEFAKRRSLYQLTAEGEAAQRAVEQVEASMGRHGSLQRFMLSAILDELKALAVEAGRPKPDPGSLYSTLLGLFGKFDELTNSAGLFMGSLNEALDAGDLADKSFRNYKAAVVVYLEQFVARLSELAPQIERAVAEVEGHGPAKVLDLAASATEAPTLEGSSDSTRAGLESRWRGLRAWFVGTAGRAPTLDLLREAGLVAINRLLGVVERVNDARFRRVSRAADLLQLARWFEAGDDEEAHRLYALAFGLGSARHMALPHEDEETVAGSSWWETPPVGVPTYLRTAGRTTRSGRVAAVEDHAAAKAALTAKLQAERDQTDRALARFAGRGPIRLTDLRSLDGGEFALFLDLIGRALSRGARGGGVLTADGRLRVRLSDPNQATVEIETPRGRFIAPDYSLQVDVVGAFEGVPA